MDLELRLLCWTSWLIDYQNNWQLIYYSINRCSSTLIFFLKDVRIFVMGCVNVCVCFFISLMYLWWDAGKPMMIQWLFCQALRFLAFGSHFLVCCECQIHPLFHNNCRIMENKCVRSVWFVLDILYNCWSINIPTDTSSCVHCNKQKTNKQHSSQETVTQCCRTGIGVFVHLDNIHRVTKWLDTI